MPKLNKTARIDKDCVACGICVRTCPLLAIAVYKGVAAVVDENKCIGCGKCAKDCPAGVITIREVTKA